MRIKVTKTEVYKFDELPEDVKDKAIENLYDINVDFDWWDCMYEDAKNVGIEITEFDLYRRTIGGNFLLSADEVAANTIRDHGDSCETYKTASDFIDAKNADDMPDDDTDEFSEWEDRMLELEEEFHRSIMEDYRILLKQEYEYLTSREAIIETIKANEYEFTLDGKIA